MTREKTPREVLKEHWGYDEFRPKQLEIIESVLGGHDTLGLLPTGGGKSITFQVPALMLDGLTIVVTPLISLMKDQVDNLRERGVKATCIYGGLTRRETTLAYDKCRLGKAKLLYVSPERLHTESFMTEARQWEVSLIVVDEAHCISQWGYDFRPSYLKIAQLRQLAGEDVPVLALTASATPRVREDIMAQLHFREGARMYSKSFDRPNLSYVVRLTDAKEAKLAEVLKNTKGTAIVYVRSRARTREISDELNRQGISASYYHAGLDAEEKFERQERWKRSEIRVMVATNAFGMGIDKADVRTVVHMDAPPSLEEYYQEAGRAGRDGEHSFAVTVTSTSYKGVLTRRLGEAFPPKDYVRRVYELAGNYLGVAVGEGYNQLYEFDLNRFCTTYGLQMSPVKGSLALLGQSGYLEFIDEAPSRSRIMMTCRRDELYEVRAEGTAERVLTAVLRLYTGLFADYVYVNETKIAQAAECGDNDVYEALLALQRMKVLHYVPRKAIPYVYYPTSRELPKHVELPRSVYEERRKLMEARLGAVKEFVFGTARCRTQVLLEYFGETDTEPCGHCDVCRARKKAEKGQKEGDEDRDAALLRMAAGREGIELAELAKGLRQSAEATLEQVRRLVEAEKARVRGTRVYKS